MERLGLDVRRPYVSRGDVRLGPTLSLLEISGDVRYVHWSPTVDYHAQLVITDRFKRHQWPMAMLGRQPVTSFLHHLIVHPSVEDIIIKGGKRERSVASRSSLDLQERWRLAINVGQPPRDTHCIACSDSSGGVSTCPFCLLTLHDVCAMKIRRHHLHAFSSCGWRLEPAIRLDALDRWIDPSRGRVYMCDICVSVLL